MQSTIPASQHNIEIQRNRDAWMKKPVLREIYHGFYQGIAARVDSSSSNVIVELGSGMGHIKEVIPHCITTDIFPNPWLDRQENAYALSFDDASLDALVLFDVWHHLRYPGRALQEFHRVLKTGGRVVLFEPAGSLLGRIVYGKFHHEGMDPAKPTEWSAPADFQPGNLDYYTDQYASSRVFWTGQDADPCRFAGWTIREVQPIVSFAYWAQGGLSKPTLLPSFLFNAVRQFDRLAQRLPRLCAARLLVVLEKKS